VLDLFRDILFVPLQQLSEREIAAAEKAKDHFRFDLQNNVRNSARAL